MKLSSRIVFYISLLPSCVALVGNSVVRMKQNHHEPTTTALFGVSSSADASDRNNPLIENFREARGLEGIYRCANTDGLAKLFQSSDVVVKNNLDEAERLVLYDAGLVIDLRSPSERNEKNAVYWMERAPGGPISIRYNEQTENSSCRSVLRLDILKNTKLFEYMDQNWMTPQQKIMAGLYKAVDIDKLHNMRMDILNQKGLLGLYEALIDIGQDDFLTALQEITLHLEKQVKEASDGNVVIHCVQGKDRTGLLVALCQSIMGISREDIVADYHLSHVMKNGAWAARAGSPQPGKLDRNLFSGAPKHLMQDTLDVIEEKYGSVSPGYLNAIGFTRTWQDRFVNAMQQQMSARKGTAEAQEEEVLLQSRL